MRTSIRRLESAYSLFPQSCKTTASDKYLKQCKTFFRRNSSLRDNDVIVTRLKRHKKVNCEQLLKPLQNNRMEQLAKATAMAIKLDKEPLPELVNTSVDLSPMFESQVNKRTMGIISNMPIALADEENIEIVHEMRKDAKKLFYLLEPDDNPANLQQKKTLKFFQHLTGDIHDGDITMEFLRKHLNKNTSAEELLEAEQTLRHSYFHQLLDFLADDEWQKMISLPQPRA